MDTSGYYTKDTRIWIPDPTNVWISGTLLADLKDNVLEIQLEDGREVVLDLNASKGQPPPLRNPDILIGANDLTSLSYLHEPAVLYNLKERFLNSESIYTYCGIVLVALNPYQDVPLYGPDIISAYSGRPIGDMDPHVYAVAENAFRSMINNDKNQSIIVSGESGAGKTVSAKYAMRYFANVGGNMTETTVELKVMASNPIMESIGNAKTIRNDNSSRFGKYLEINFNGEYNIIGAHMKTYLLEKSRVVYQAADERNYHIFYQLCASRHLPESKELNLSSAEEFYYTQQGGDAVIKGVDDHTDFLATTEAMGMLGIYSEQQRMMWRILAAILHLGNIELHASGKDKDQCYIKNTDIHAQMVSSLLGIDHSQLSKWLCARKIIATGDVYVKPLTWKEADNGRDALAKHIYSQLFKWIVEHLNSSLAITTQRKSFIGVLDIYGFETFEVNSFEQFCINYANEKLQQQFNQHVFKLEQEEYIREAINWSFIDFYDNQPCIDLIEMKLGILDLLDEECRMPKGADASWAQKLYKQHLKVSDHFVKPRMSDTAFIIRHYADDVIYDCAGFVEKNRDAINEEHLGLLRASEYELVAELFDVGDSLMPPRKRTNSMLATPPMKGTRTKKTVGSQFRESLSKLMETLNSTTPHYIRCIKSNDFKAPFQLDLGRCVQQLRACGVLETIRISAAGYPSRWTYQEFFDRYRMLISWNDIDWNSITNTCDIILKSFIKDDDKFQLGKTKLFFRAGAVAFLERIRSDILKQSCIKIQKNVKRWLVYKKFKRLRSATILIQSWIRGHLARKLAQFLRETAAAIKIQKIWRGHTLRQEYLKIRNFLILVQSCIRGVLVRRRVRKQIILNKTIIIQKYFRRYRARKNYLKIRKGIILIQCCVRRRAAKKELKRLKIEARSVEHYKTLTKGMEKKVMTLQQKLTEETDEKRSLKNKVSMLISVEEEVHELRNVKLENERLLKSSNEQTSKLQSENESLKADLDMVNQGSKNLSEEVKNIKTEKEQEISNLQSSIDLLRVTLAEQKRKQEEEQALAEKTLIQKLQEQKEELLAEFNIERASHQRMLGEYARLEQRFSNLHEEMQMMKNTSDKRKSISVNAEEDNEKVQNNADEQTPHLLSEIKELREENTELRNLLNKKDSNQMKEIIISRSGKGSNIVDSSHLTNGNEEVTISRSEKAADIVDSSHLTNGNEEMVRSHGKKAPETGENSQLINENQVLRKELEDMKKKLIETSSRTLTSPPRSPRSPRSPSRIPISEFREEGLMRTRSNVLEMRRPSQVDKRIADGELTGAGKLLMTYAGLSRKRSTSKIPSPTRVAKRGILKFEAEEQETLVSKLVSQIDPSNVEREIPGLPAHILFMALRYVDHVNNERLMQSYLATVITSIKKVMSRTPIDLDHQAFWLNNVFRLYCDMKQFSGEELFQSANTREQNQHCLQNFDLSEYRQVLSDMCVQIYRDMASNIQERIANLIVPGMLEYESIPGVVSTLRNFKAKIKTANEIITVKDITNKLTAILSVLNAYCVDPSLIKQIFRQIYYFINATMVNNVLLRKDMCHWSRGLQMKFNLTQLEEWCRINQLHYNNDISIIEVLEPITAVVQLLQVNKKSISDLEGILEISTKLNTLQVQKILSMYTTPNDYEPRVPGNLIRAVVSKMKKDENAGSLMLNLKHIIPMTVSFVPSTVGFEKVVIPPSLKLDNFEII